MVALQKQLADLSKRIKVMKENVGSQINSNPNIDLELKEEGTESRLLDETAPQYFECEEIN